MSDSITGARLPQGLLYLLLAAGLLLLSVVTDVATGPSMLPFSQVIHTLINNEAEQGARVIIFGIRLPVALMAIMVGAALGLSGLVMQTVLHNPLASSYTLGVSAGAGFGAALMIVLGTALPLPETLSIPLAAFIFAGIACACVLLIGHTKGGNADSYVLGGIALLFLFQSLLSLLQYLASPEALQSIVFWLFGSLYKADWQKLMVLTIVVGFSLPVLLRDAWRFTALGLSDERAMSLGVNVRALRWRSLAMVSLLTGAAVAFVGTIGFIGLIAPHIARFLLGEDQRLLLPGSALCGALLLSLSSVMGKLLAPNSMIPIGIITATIGVPFFLALIMRTKSRDW